MVGELDRAQQNANTVEARAVVDTSNSRDQSVSHSASLRLYDDLQALSGLPGSTRGATSVPDQSQLSEVPLLNPASQDFLGAVSASTNALVITPELDSQRQDTGVRDVTLTRSDGTQEPVWRYADPSISAQPAPPADIYATGQPLYDGSFSNFGAPPVVVYDPGMMPDYSNCEVGYDIGPNGRFLNPGLAMMFRSSGYNNYNEFMRHRYQEYHQSHLGTNTGNGQLTPGGVFQGTRFGNQGTVEQGNINGQGVATISGGHHFGFSRTPQGATVYSSGETIQYPHPTRTQTTQGGVVINPASGIVEPPVAHRWTPPGALPGQPLAPALKPHRIEPLLPNAATGALPTAIPSGLRRQSGAPAPTEAVDAGAAARAQAERLHQQNEAARIQAEKAQADLARQRAEAARANAAREAAIAAQHPAPGQHPAAIPPVVQRKQHP